MSWLDGKICGFKGISGDLMGIEWGFDGGFVVSNIGITALGLYHRLDVC